MGRRTGETKQLLQLLDETGLSDDDQLRNATTLAAIHPNERVADQLHCVIAAKAIQHTKLPFDIPQPQATIPDESLLDLGSFPTGARFRLEDADLTKHMLVAGQTGAGKTTLFYTLLDELAVPVWAFDLKQDYRHWLHHDAAFTVLPWPHLRYNPLCPPHGVAPHRWAQVVAEVFGHSQSWLDASKNYFMAFLMELYDEYDIPTKEPVTDPNQHEWPTLHDLHDALDGTSVQPYSKESNYRSVVLNRIDALLRVAGDVFDCQQGLDIATWLGQDVVFEFDGLRTSFQDLFMELLFAGVYEHRVAVGDRDAGLQHVFMLDEGKRIFSVYKERSDAAGIPHISTVTAKMREFGEALVVADQEPTKLSDSLKANALTTVLLPVGSNKQLTEMTGERQGVMQLSKRQREYATRLAIGEGIVQVGKADPVPVQFTYTQVPKDISDADLEHRFRKTWATLSESPSSPSPNTTASASATSPETTVTPAQSSQQVAADAVSAPVLRLLNDVAVNQFKPLTERYELFEYPKQGIRVKNAAIDQGLLREKPVRTQNGKVKLLELTSTGRSVLADREVSVTYQGRGGVVHRYWQREIKRVFEESGWTAQLEQHDADVFAEKEGRAIAVEVALSSRDREVQHVRDRLAVADDVWVGCPSQEVLVELEQKLAHSEIQLDAVRIDLLKRILDRERM